MPLTNEDDMKRMGMLAVACTALALACGEPAAPTAMALSRFSGTWSGTRTITQAGGCTFSGGPAPTSMQWTVTDEGEVTIAAASGPSWGTGTVTTDLSVTITHTGTANCGGTPHTFTSTYTGTIRRDGLLWAIALEATETWCPPNCTFHVVYALVKP